MQLNNIIENNLPKILSLRELLSVNAELSTKEFKTQKIIMDFLKQLNIASEICFNTGVVGNMNEGTTCIALRADMDALPVNGVSHACGHDFHMAVILGCALVLKEVGYSKPIKFIFQPAEEAEGGALPMIEAGILKNPEVKEIIGFHVWPELPVGSIEISPGASMASVDDFHVKFIGIGGHAAMPDKFNNPILPAIEFINSTNFKSGEGLITVAAINAGNAPNVVVEEALIKGTVRTFNSDLRIKLKETIFENANKIATAYNCKAEIYYSWQYPPLINDEKITLNFIESCKKIFKDENIKPIAKTFAAEDFSFFAEKVPSIHFRLGISEAGLGNEPLHSPYFSVNEKAVFYGIYAICNYLLS